jgi:outer membrane protein assembly factor BamB
MMKACLDPPRQSFPSMLLRYLASVAIACLLSCRLFAGDVDPDSDWPSWRGPQGTGVAAGDQKIPWSWSKSENVVWKASVPGRGHGSPIVVGNRVFLQTADEQNQVQSVLCFDRATGEQRWKTDVHSDNLEKKGNQKSSQASSTPACDGERLYVNFLNNGSVFTTALDFDGRQLWQQKVSDFVMHQGYGSSPVLYEKLVFVTSDNKGGGVIAALDRASGNVVWSHERPKQPNYVSPVVLNVCGKQQLLISGCDLISSFEPSSGKKLWEVAGATTECVTNIVTDGQRVFVSGGYPRNHVQALRADGTGKTDWENGARVYVPSMIVRDGYLYAIQDAGIATCWNSETGKEVWNERIGGTFSGSLVLVGDVLLATNEAGETHLWKANPQKFERIGKNKLGDESYASAAVCAGRIYLRTVDKSGGQRQEMLYCLGAK